MIFLICAFALAALLPAIFLHARLRAENTRLRRELAAARTPIAAAIPPAAAGQSAAEPGIDLAAGLKAVGGNPKLFHKFLRDFREKYREFSTQAKTSLETGNPAQLEVLAHTLKGNAAMLGFKDLSAACARLESLAHDAASATRCAEALHGVTLGLVPAFQAIHLTLGEDQPGTDPGASGVTVGAKSPARLQALLAEAYDLLDRGEYGAHAILAAIEATWDVSACRDRFGRIRVAVENGDYDEACRDLRELIAQGSIQ